MCREIWGRIVRNEYQDIPARLEHYARYKLANRDYPGLLARDQASTDGVIYLDVTKPDLERLDRFEGEEYERIRVQVADQTGKPYTACTYLYKSCYAHQVLAGEWSYSEFQAKGYQHFLDQYRGFAGL